MAVVICIGAHQDDDTLIMGGCIDDHVHAGHVVYYATITDGCGSALRKNVAPYNGWTDAQFMAARDTETNNAVIALGASTRNSTLGRLADGQTNANRHIGNDVSLSKLNMKVVNRVRDVIQKVAMENDVNVIDVRVKTHSYNDPHADHMAVCAAVLYLLYLGEISDVRLYVHTDNWYDGNNGFPSAATLGAGREASPSAPEHGEAILRYVATTDTHFGQPGKAVYGIGYQSVSGMFNTVWGDTCSYVYAPPAPIRNHISWDDSPVGKINVATPLYTTADTGSAVLRNMVAGEVVMFDRNLTGSFRGCITGTGSSFPMGYILDSAITPIRATSMNIVTRYALYAYTDVSRTTKLADIPSGAKLVPFGGIFAEDVLTAFNTGSLCRIMGYTIGSDPTIILHDCFVDTNWVCGNQSLYNVYLA